MVRPTAETIRVWLVIHRWTSLVATAFLLMLCITGLPLIFRHEIDHALGYRIDPPPWDGPAMRASLDSIVADARTRRPDQAVQFIVRDPDEPNAWFVRMGNTIAAPQASAFDMYDARSGAFLHTYPLNQGPMHVILRLHVDMFAGLPGMLFLGFIGVLLIASLVSGTVLYGRFMARLAFGTVRWRPSHRVRWLDLHNLLGIVTLAWVTVVGATGVINTLSIPIFRQWQATQLAEMIPAAGSQAAPGPASAERALAAARTALPAAELSFLAFPGNPFAGPRHFVAFMQGTTPLTEHLLEPVLIDAPTGAVLAVRQLPWYVSALLLSQPLHFGDYGGLPLKVLWGLLDLMTIVVLGSGIYLWAVRGRAGHRAIENAASASPTAS